MSHTLLFHTIVDASPHSVRALFFGFFWLLCFFFQSHAHIVCCSCIQRQVSYTLEIVEWKAATAANATKQDQVKYENEWNPRRSVKKKQRAAVSVTGQVNSSQVGWAEVEANQLSIFQVFKLMIKVSGATFFFFSPLWKMELRIIHFASYSCLQSVLVDVCPSLPTEP